MNHDGVVTTSNKNATCIDISQQTYYRSFCYDGKNVQFIISTQD